ncbi:dicarboxylate transporter/tellurite-resistance protein TehA [Dyella sp. C11]|uniref:dicarboxylate transporter/tellurite-resistance protein TehA n=1 Tax=Dyella sp. C11 TaxID=2126991 RepID=UPI000D65053F|nr:dicarboxylate transporter/tellurite-resistance protein TehA [Dyella sp. C11]
MTSQTRLPIVPASFFGIVLGIAGLGGAWRVAHRVWQLPAMVGEVLMLLATLVWATLLALYVAKWIVARSHATTELGHPIQCCFVGLIGVTTMLIAVAALPYSHDAAMALFVLGAIYTVAFAVWRTGGLWQGGRDTAHTTAVLYLPTVAGSFVTAAVSAALGYAGWGELAFGAGMFSWLAIESVLLHRLYTAEALPLAIRPTIGIQLAPPLVGSLAYLNLTEGLPNLFVHALLGYGLLQALILLRMLPWIRAQPFSAGYWGFTFGVTALATAPLRLIERGDTGPIALLAPYLFIGGNIVVVLMMVLTLKLLLQGKLVPPPPQPQPVSPSP